MKGRGFGPSPSFLILLTMGIATRGEARLDSSKYLFFRDAAGTYSCYPVNNLIGFSENGSSATGLIVYFLPHDDMRSTFFDFIELTVTNHEDAIKDIMEEIAFSKKTVITIADDVNSNYISSNISATDGQNNSTDATQN